MLDEITVAAVELRLRGKLDEVRIEEIRYHLEDESGNATSEELSAATMALRFESLSAEVKEVVEASERARVLESHGSKGVQNYCKRRLGRGANAAEQISEGNQGDQRGR